MQERFPWQLSLATSYLGFFYQVYSNTDIFYHYCGATLALSKGQDPDQTDKTHLENIYP